MNEAAKEYEKAVNRAHRGWEWYIIAASALYLAGHFGAWAWRGFAVNQAFNFYAQESK